MQQDKPTINLTVPTGWDQLNDKQLRYVFGLMAQGFSTVQIKTYCLFRWTGMQVMHKYGKGWWCKFAHDEFVIMAEQVNSAIAALDWIDSLPSKPVCISRIGKHRALTADFRKSPSRRSSSAITSTRATSRQRRTHCLTTLRELFRQYMSLLILEKTKLEQHCIYLDPRISFNEIDRYFFSGCACAYFQIAVDVYTDLRYNADEWE